MRTGGQAHLGHGGKHLGRLGLRHQLLRHRHAHAIPWPHAACWVRHQLLRLLRLLHLLLHLPHLEVLLGLLEVLQRLQTRETKDTRH